LAGIGEKHHKSTVQIILRWHIQTWNIVVPKSTDEKHQQDNGDIFDFSLDDDDMTLIAQLDKNTSYFKCPLWLDELKARLFLRI